MPGALFQGSLALGSIVQGALGVARAGGTLAVHPFLIAGWAGLVSTALNLLPVGSIDGGRITQARRCRRCRNNPQLTVTFTA